MPGTLLLDDWQAFNREDLGSHLNDLWARVTRPPASDELQSHLQSLLVPEAAAPPPVVTPPPPAAPAAPSAVDELQAHLTDLTGGGLQLLGEGVQNLRQAVSPPPPLTPESTVEPVASTEIGSAPIQAAGTLQDYARQAATRAGIDPDIFQRQIQQESGFDPTAKSPAGASGIAQIVPQYHPGVDTSDPYASLDYAANLMRSNLDKYGGDYRKALAAYNAGGGAVDQYGDVPPFAETQKYVANILGGAKQQVEQAVQPYVQAGQQAFRDISQFGDSQLTADEAYAACGPAAAVRFAQRFGRNPTLREALDLARTVGWTSDQGMAGLGSEKALMDKMGVATRMVSGADWGTFANEAKTGNPVTISTTGHYFTADGWDPATNRFHVGRSGLDLKGGSEWMTPEQMTALMGPVQGGLLADNPTVPPSTISADTGFVAPTATPSPLAQIGEGVSRLGQGVLTVLDDAVNRVGSAAQRADELQRLGLGPAQNLPAWDPSRSVQKNLIAGTGIDPLGQLQRGAPQIVRGVQQGDIGQALGGAAQVGGALISALPGGGEAQLARTLGPSQAERLVTSPGVQRFLSSEEGALNLGQVGRPIDYDALAQLRRERAVQPEMPGTPTAAPNRADQVMAFSVNNMLSNPASLLANAAGGLLETVKRPLVTAATGDLGAAGADLRAQGLAIGDVLANAGTTLTTGRRVSQAVDQPEAFQGAAGIVATPFLRVMGATDEFIYGLSQAGAQASELVRLMRANPTLSQAEVMQRFREGILDAGQRSAAEATFQTGGTGLGASLAGARRGFTAPEATPGQRVRGAVANVLTPFSVVPDVLLSRGAMRIPGINELVTAPVQIARALGRGDPVAAKRAAASAALATATNLAIWAQVQQGNITGSGPDDPARRRALMNARDDNGNPLWRPNSIRVGDQWVPYSSLGGVAVQLGAIANGVEKWDETGKEISPQYARAVSTGLVETITDAWYLQTVAGVFDAIRTSKLPEWLGGQALSTAARAIPESGLLGMLKGIKDPVQRQPEPKLADPASWLDYFKARVPGLSETVQPRIDPATGRPVEDPRTPASALVRGTAPGEPSLVNETLARHNLGVGDAPRTVTVGSGRNAVTIAITEDEQRRFLELAGPQIERNVLDFAHDPQFATFPLEDRRAMLERAISSARDQAGLELASQLSDVEFDRRVAAYEESQRRQAEPSVRLR